MKVHLARNYLINNSSPVSRNGFHQQLNADNKLHITSIWLDTEKFCKKLNTHRA